MSNFGGAGGAEYEFITQDHATSIQMKLAWRAYLARNIYRSPDFICLDMSSAHRKTRLAWLPSGEKCRRASPRLAARGHTGHTAQMHNYNQIAFAITLVAHAVRCRASTLERPKPAKQLLYDEYVIVCVRVKRESPLGVQGAIEAKSPDPLHERGFHVYSQTGRLSREERAERERESCLDT